MAPQSIVQFRIFCGQFQLPQEVRKGTDVGLSRFLLVSTCFRHFPYTMGQLCQHVGMSLRLPTAMGQEKDSQRPGVLRPI